MCNYQNLQTVCPRQNIVLSFCLQPWSSRPVCLCSMFQALCDSQNSAMSWQLWRCLSLELWWRFGLGSRRPWPCFWIVFFKLFVCVCLHYWWHTRSYILSIVLTYTVLDYTRISKTVSTHTFQVRFQHTNFKDSFNTHIFRCSFNTHISTCSFKTHIFKIQIINTKHFKLQFRQ